MNGPAESGRLWDKGLPLDAAMHRFTVGDDPTTDLVLLPFDALGTAAHVLTLMHGKYVGERDARALVEVLQGIAESASVGRFAIRPEQEDGHTALEAALVAAVGEPGKRVHLGRSRNDQIILATRLYLREELVELGLHTAALADAFVNFCRLHGGIPMPGYTHLRRAMPSSLGQWSGAFAEALAEELEVLQAVYLRLDRCPAGAAAGFGAPVPLDRPYTARLLGFARVQDNPVDVQNSRGRHELAVLRWLCGVADVLEKYLWDVALYSTEEFGFLQLPDALTTGSSIMPQKRNPDVVELARGSCRALRGEAALLEQIATGLPSNYHRDLQLLKTPLVRALARGGELIAVTARLVDALMPMPQRLSGALTPELWAAHEASRRVAAGLAFRDAYREVAGELLAGTFLAAPAAAPEPAAVGGIAEALAAQRAWLDERRARHVACERRVWNYFEDRQ